MIGQATKDKKYSDLNKLFSSQIKTLRSHLRNRFGKCLAGPSIYVEVMNRFLSQRIRVLEKASNMNIGEGNIPFLPVFDGRPIDMVRIGKKVGFNNLCTWAWLDIVNIPIERDYYIFDVENGCSTIGKNPKDAHEIIRSQIRSPLTTDETIALCVHTSVLSSHDVWAVGSRCDYVHSVPFIKAKSFLDSGPQLDKECHDKSNDKCGSPSCVYRLD